MNFIKSIEYNLLHSKRAKLIKKYPRVPYKQQYNLLIYIKDFIATFTTIYLFMNVLRGNLKTVNRYSETSFSGPINHANWFVLGRR